MFDIKITGMDKVKKELDEMQRAAKALNGAIAEISFTPGDPESVERAVREMEQAVDAKAAGYQHNAMVKAFIPEAKKSFEKQIREAKGA